MGLRGPKPIPSAIKLARGTYRPDRAAANEPKPLGKPVCPSFLNADARKEFRRVVKMLTEMGLIGRIDGNALARYAVTWCRWRQALQMIEKTGEMQVFREPDGKVKAVQQSPYASLARALSEELSRIEACFGMHPSARSRLSVANPAPPEAHDKGRFFNDPPLRMAE